MIWLKSITQDTLSNLAGCRRFQKGPHTAVVGAEMCTYPKGLAQYFFTDGTHLWTNTQTQHQSTTALQNLPPVPF